MRLTFTRLLARSCLAAPARRCQGAHERGAGASHRVAHVLLGAGLAIAATSLVGKTRWAEVFDFSLAIGVWLIGAAAAVMLTGRELAAERRRSSRVGSKLDSRMERLSDLHWRIEDSAARYRDLLDELDAIVCRRDVEGRLTFVNRAFCRLFGVRTSDVLGTAFRPLAAGGTSVSIPPAGQPRTFTVEVSTTLGLRWLSFAEHRVPGIDGEGPEVQCVARDVTQERESARELAAAKAQAETANRAKSRFLAAVSHEIRTPMNGILGMVGLIADTQQTLEQQSYTRTIEQSARQLLGLIDEVLDFSRIEASKIEIDQQPFSVEILVQDVIELLAPRAFAKDLEVAWSIEPSLPASLVGDAARIRQIVLNLVGNAIKFTDRGGVWVEVGGEPAGDGTWRLTFAVRDTGIGLSPEAISRIFGEFEQAADHARDRRGGTGLGLSISQGLARAMGGEITVSSRPQRGATFTFAVVLAAGAESGRLYPAAATVAPEDGSARVLLMLDRLIERRSLADLLRRAGLEVDEVDTVEGPARIRSASALNRAYAVVVVDSEDGAGELAGLIERPATRGLVLVAPSARADLKAFRASGFDEFLIRPVRPRTLLNRLFKLDAEPALAGEASVEGPREGRVVMPCSAPVPPVRPRPVLTLARPGDEPGKPVASDNRSAAPGLPPFAKVRPHCRVLLVEDNPVNALVASRALEKFQCSIATATDGLAAVSHMRRVLSGQEPAIDVILMDMNMPHMGGAEATRAIRALYAEARPGSGPVAAPPIIAVTAYAFEEDRRRCLAAGMDDYLAKPFSRGDLERCIERWAGRDRLMQKNLRDVAISS